MLTHAEMLKMIGEHCDALGSVQAFEQKFDVHHVGEMLRGDRALSIGVIKAVGYEIRYVPKEKEIKRTRYCDLPGRGY